jgi:hypothetical protein
LDQSYDATYIGILFIAAIVVCLSAARLNSGNLFRSGDHSTGRVVLLGGASPLRLVRVLRAHQTHT